MKLNNEEVLFKLKEKSEEQWVDPTKANQF